MISFLLSLEIIGVVISDPNIFFFWIAAHVADADAVYPNGIKTLLANGLSTFHIMGNPILVTALKVYLKTLLCVVFYIIEFLIILY